VDGKSSRYIILVSTIEPRKGHGLMQAVWRRLLKDGIPQQSNVTLLLVGRVGWLVDGLVNNLLSLQRTSVLNEVDDAALARLYDESLFCVYPSEYEGYGLPVVEGLARGKPVLASDVGVISEIHSSLLKRLSAGDEEAWYQAVRSWLCNPETRPRSDVPFKHPTWPEASAQIFGVIDEFIGRAATSRSGETRGVDGG
jgi:glycosyltransferase involved in cell wall biosynthesis